jgi:hypothetical protein
MQMARASVSIGVLSAAAAFFWASGGLAQQSDSALKNVMKIFGFATDVAPPADFVLQTRPKGALDYIPVFQPPPEPAKPALNGKELNAAKGDLEAVQKRDDATRQAFPPAVKAMAEEKAAEAKKAKANAPAASQ